MKKKSYVWFAYALLIILSLISVSANYPNWEPNIAYTTGDIVYYTVDSNYYEVLQPHTSAAHWTPDVTSSLYALTTIEECGEFDFCTGEWVEIGDIILYQDVYYRVIQAHTTQSDWAPNIVPALFEPLLKFVENKPVIKIDSVEISYNETFTPTLNTITNGINITKENNNATINVNSKNYTELNKAANIKIENITSLTNKFIIHKIEDVEQNITLPVYDEVWNETNQNYTYEIIGYENYTFIDKIKTKQNMSYMYFDEDLSFGVEGFSEYTIMSDDILTINVFNQHTRSNFLEYDVTIKNTDTLNETHYTTTTGSMNLNLTGNVTYEINISVPGYNFLGGTTKTIYFNESTSLSFYPFNSILNLSALNKITRDPMDVMYSSSYFYPVDRVYTITSSAWTYSHNDDYWAQVAIFGETQLGAPNAFLDMILAQLSSCGSLASNPVAHYRFYYTDGTWADSAVKSGNNADHIFINPQPYNPVYQIGLLLYSDRFSNGRTCVTNQRLNINDYRTTPINELPLLNGTNYVTLNDIGDTFFPKFTTFDTSESEQKEMTLELYDARLKIDVNNIKTGTNFQEFNGTITNTAHGFYEEFNTTTGEAFINLVKNYEYTITIDTADYNYTAGYESTILVNNTQENFTFYPYNSIVNFDIIKKVTNQPMTNIFFHPYYNASSVYDFIYDDVTQTHFTMDNIMTADNAAGGETYYRDFLLHDVFVDNISFTTSHHTSTSSNTNIKIYYSDSSIQDLGNIPSGTYTLTNINNTKSIKKISVIFSRGWASTGGIDIRAYMNDFKINVDYNKNLIEPNNIQLIHGDYNYLIVNKEYGEFEIIDTFTIAPNENLTITEQLYDAQLDIKVHNAQTNTYFNNFNGTIRNDAYGFIETFSTTTGTSTLGLTQGIDYEVEISVTGYDFLEGHIQNITINSANQEIEFNPSDAYLFLNITEKVTNEPVEDFIFFKQVHTNVVDHYKDHYLRLKDMSKGGDANWASQTLFIGNKNITYITTEVIEGYGEPAYLYFEFVYDDGSVQTTPIVAGGIKNISNPNVSKKVETLKIFYRTSFWGALVVIKDTKIYFDYETSKENNSLIPLINGAYDIIIGHQEKGTSSIPTINLVSGETQTINTQVYNSDISLSINDPDTGVAIPEFNGTVTNIDYGFVEEYNTTNGSVDLELVQGVTYDLTFTTQNFTASNIQVYSDEPVQTMNVTPVYGCTDPEAFNYDPLANIDDGSCVYAGCTDSRYSNYDATAAVDDGSCAGWLANYCTENVSPCGGGCPITLFYNMFNGYNFDTDVNGVGNITGWNTSCVTNMEQMFRNSNFNQPIGSWDVSGVTNMDQMFYNAQFNQPIGSWDVSGVTSMASMFYANQQFNQDISNWNTSEVTWMVQMFAYANGFNQPIGSWDTSKVLYMNGMFEYNTGFNQPIGSWDTGKVIQMVGMFRGATSFNQPLGSWNVSSVTNMLNMFNSITLSPENYDDLLSGWSDLILKNNVNFHAGNSKYTFNVIDNRAHIVDTYGWTITDGGLLSYGCTDPLANNYDPAAITDDGSCIYQVSPNISLNSSTGGWVVDYDEVVAVTGVDCPVGLNCTLYRDGLQVSNPDVVSLDVGSYNYVFNTSGNQDYFAESVNQTLVVESVAGNVNARLNGVNDDLNITYGDLLNVSVWSDTDQPLLIFLNGSDITDLNGVDQLLDVGYYEVVVFAGDTLNYDEVSLNRFVTVNKATPNLSISNVTSQVIYVNESVNVTGSGCPLGIDCILYLGDVEVNNPFTDELRTGEYYFVYNTSGNNNYESATTNYILSVIPLPNTFQGRSGEGLDEAREAEIVEEDVEEERLIPVIGLPVPTLDQALIVTVLLIGAYLVVANSGVASASSFKSKRDKKEWWRL